MDLDSRIIEGKSYLDCFDTEIGKKFIGKECYLSDGVASFANIDNLNKATLIEVDDENIKPYTLENIRWRYSSNFILPCEWVKEPEEKPEKKYRAYSLNEFLDEHEIGDIITYRVKEDVQHEKYVRCKKMFCGCQILTGEADTPGKGFIDLGGALVSLQTLFEDYETPNSYLYPEVWEPFGVEE